MFPATAESVPAQVAACQRRCQMHSVHGGSATATWGDVATSFPFSADVRRPPGATPFPVSDTACDVACLRTPGQKGVQAA